MSKIDDPEIVMLRIFTILVDMAREEAYRALGYPPERFGMEINSDGYETGRPLYIPSRSFEYNTPSFILNKFTRVEQSARVLSLIGKNLWIEIKTTGSMPKGLTKKKPAAPRIVGSSGRDFLDDQAAVSGDDSGDEVSDEESSSMEEWIDNTEYADDGPRMSDGELQSKLTFRKKY